MQADLLGLISVGLLALTSFGLLLSTDWRWLILTLAVQYIGVFLLVWASWPLEQAVVTVIAGWMAGAVLGTTLLSVDDLDAGPSQPVNRLFRFFAGLLMLVFTYSISPRLLDWVPGASLIQIWGGWLLIGMGVLHLGLNQQPLRVVLALLTFLSGFEILYAVVENSILITGLLALVTIGVALAGSYLLVAPIMNEEL
jgi:hypothetical protein